MDKKNKSPEDIVSLFALRHETGYGSAFNYLTNDDALLAVKQYYNQELTTIQEANAKLVEALRNLMTDIRPENWCRGRFEHLTGDKNKAYVGGKGAPSDESIVAAMELLQTYETK